MAVCYGFWFVNLCFWFAYVVTKLQHIRRYYLELDSYFPNLEKILVMKIFITTAYCFDPDKFAAHRSCNLFRISEVHRCSRKPMTKIKLWKLFYGYPVNDLPDRLYFGTCFWQINSCLNRMWSCNRWYHYPA